MADYASLGVEPFLIRALAAMAIRTPTPVQAPCVPAILSGRDCIGQAQTGSGKTIAFALPILQALARDPFGVFAIVLTPTRCVDDRFGRTDDAASSHFRSTSSSRRWARQRARGRRSAWAGWT